MEKVNGKAVEVLKTLVSGRDLVARWPCLDQVIPCVGPGDPPHRLFE